MADERRREARNASYFIFMVLKKPWFYEIMVFQGHSTQAPLASSSPVI
jgi:hypothetical protein